MTTIATSAISTHAIRELSSQPTAQTATGSLDISFGEPPCASRRAFHNSDALGHVIHVLSGGRCCYGKKGTDKSTNNTDR